jgi:hypothetical protein
MKLAGSCNSLRVLQEITNCSSCIGACPHPIHYWHMQHDPQHCSLFDAPATLRTVADELSRAVVAL